MRNDDKLENERVYLCGSWDIKNRTTFGLSASILAAAEFAGAISLRWGLPKKTFCEQPNASDNLR